MRYVTIKDIANVLGISKSTVSRALSADSRNVSGETIRKVVETAEKMGYRKNEMAVNLRNRRAKTIGIVVPEAVTSFYLQFSATVRRSLQSYGYRIILTLSDEDFLTERSNFEIFDSYRVDGILISSCHHRANLEFYNGFIRRCIPMVFFDRTVADLECSSVRSDDYHSAFFLVEHLIYKGYRRILHLAGPDYIRNTAERLRAYRDVLKKHGIDYRPELVIPAGVDEKDGAEAMNRILDSGGLQRRILFYRITGAGGQEGVEGAQHRHSWRYGYRLYVGYETGDTRSSEHYGGRAAVGQNGGRGSQTAAREN